ncbi:MAG: Rpn family recombination-promoting nuclease/putative transposase [Stigonema ocellatum SAG 48.90 = DSM 106950]|nr:Rpn family recombination-promoting nuclease/putative transposase [Stigonema ocellatum SAG 48.90 = DSM 106950]
MKTDSIFYRLFKTFPEAFFELINQSTTDARAYDFASVELKQTAFRIDGVFVPLPDENKRPIYFLEVQFHKDVELYARLFSELFLYMRLYAPKSAWRAVVIFKTRSMEPTEVEPYRLLIESNQVTRFYLNELRDVSEQSLSLGMMKLVVETKKRTPQLVKNLLDKARAEVTDEAQQRKVLDLMETIILYKLPLISRQELAQMFSLSNFDLKKTRYYQEVKEEIREEFREEFREEVLREEALQLIQRQLPRRIGAVNQQLQQSINQLSVEQLENLAVALLDFSNEADLVTWLENNSN